MLSKEHLQQLNRYMLGLGAPVERDDVGYSKPDYALMEGIGRFNKEISDEMAYAIADRLAHYKNTQLKYLAEGIEKTVDYYKELLNKEKAPKFKDIHEKFDYSDFISYEIHLAGETEDKIAFSFDTNVYLGDVDIPYRNDVRWEDSTYQKLWVTKEHAKDLVERLKDYGKYGLEPDKILEKKLSSMMIKRSNNVHIIGNSRDDTGCYLKFDGFANIYEFQKAEKEIDPDCLKWTKVQGKSVLFVKFEEVPYLYDVIKKNGFYNDKLEEICKDVPLEDKKDRLLKVKANTPKENKKTNESGNTLMDYTKCDLPFTPYPFQIEDAEKIVANKRMLLGHDMGAGKTFIATLVGTSIDTPKLVIVPESLRLNWRKEIRNVTPDADIRILYSKDAFDLDKDHLPDWTITGYATASKYADELLDMGFKCLFIDEAHNCKAVTNSGAPKSKRAEVVLNLCEKAEFVYPMTGTPLPTRNKDLYNIFKMLEVENIGDVKMGERWSFFNYGKQYCDGYNNGFGWEFDGNSNSEELHEALSPFMVRRLKSDVLPDLTKQRMFIPMESTSKEYANLENRIRHLKDEDTYMGLAMTGRRILSKEKVKPAIDLAESILEEDKSVVLVSNFNETLDTIQKKFGDDCCCIRGGMSDNAKQQAIDDFQSGRKHVCALNIIAGGVGVTLTKAHDMVICDYDWTPANMSQVEDRICRAGQKDSCNIHYIYCENSILDTTFVKMISGKSANIDLVVDNAENTMDMSEGVSFMKALKERVEAEIDEIEEDEIER